MSQQATIHMQSLAKSTLTPVVSSLSQRAAINSSPVYEVPPIVHEVLRSSGQPLNASTRAFMEPRFGHDFSGVRVHTDTKAAESARAVNALAYTVGHDISFDAGLHESHTAAGRQLLAHELTHVIQQADGIQSNITTSMPGDKYEQEADHTAKVIDTGTSFMLNTHTGLGLMRQAKTSPAAKEEDKDVKELKDKVGGLVKNKFGGDYKKAFDAYDSNKDGAIDAAELGKLLEDAGVGKPWTRPMWVSGIMKEMDKNKDGKIQWSEFESAIK
jgi:hypothetical protein